MQGNSGMGGGQPWLLCIHNIPPKPPYLRAKVARRLAALGAVAIKNSVYVLPDTPAHRDGLTWIAKEIEQGCGKAYVCRAFFDGLDGGGFSDAHLRQLFVDAREADYRSLAAEFQPAADSLPSPATADEALVLQVRQWNAQLKARYEAILAMDFFGTPGRGAIEGLLAAFDSWLATYMKGSRPEEATALDPRQYQGRVWVTRPGVHVDRIACAWLIRRFVDPEAVFRFGVDAVPQGAVRFDMADGEFSHEGPLCTFEVMLKRFGLEADAALSVLGQVVHDIDLDENTPARAESAGILALLSGICLETDVDEERVETGGKVLDMLYAHFRRSGKR